jgi:hypothetical protein
LWCIFEISFCCNLYIKTFRLHKSTERVLIYKLVCRDHKSKHRSRNKTWVLFFLVKSLCCIFSSSNIPFYVIYLLKKVAYFVCPLENLKSQESLFACLGMSPWNWTWFWTRPKGFWILNNVCKLKLQGFKIGRTLFEESPKFFLKN